MTRNNFKNKFNIGKIYGAKVFDDTVHYQNQYWNRKSCHMEQ